MSSVPIPAVILAGGQPKKAFVDATGLTHRALLRVPDPEPTGETATLTMLELAIRSLRRCARISDVYVVSDLQVPPDVHQVPDQGGFVDNLFAGLGRCAGAERACICTADMPFLTAASAARFLDASLAIAADLVYPIVKADVCARAYPGMKRTSLPTREGRFTGGNLVLVRPAALLAARAHIEAAHAHRKSPLRLALMLGMGATIAVGLSLLTGQGMVSVGALEKAASRLIHASARACFSDDPAIATDVDRPEDVAAVRELTQSR